jgi:hypothetical protein
VSWLFLAAVLALLPPLPTITWSGDYPAALARAKREHKLMVLNFTGSDWDSWSKRLNDEALFSDRFFEFADRRLVLVTVDFPRYRTMTLEVRHRNEALKKTYGVSRLPTIVVTDSNGKALLVQNGYQYRCLETLINAISMLPAPRPLEVEEGPPAGLPTIRFPH